MFTEYMGGKIEFTNMDLFSKEGWDAFLSQRKDRARELSKKKDPGFVDTTLVLTVHPETGAPLSEGRFMLALYATCFHSETDNDDEVEAQKDNYATILRLSAIAGHAVGSIWRSEAWMSTSDKLDDPNRVQPRHDPKRKEAIYLLAQHRDFDAQSFSAFIDPHPSKPWKRVIAPWHDAGGVAGGRFANFLPTPKDLSNPFIAMAARAYLQKQGGLEKIFEHNPIQGPPQ